MKAEHFERPGEIPHCSNCLCAFSSREMDRIWTIILAEAEQAHLLGKVSEVENSKNGSTELFWGRVSGMVTLLSTLTNVSCKEIYERIYNHLESL
jgi:hypothetical protein